MKKEAKLCLFFISVFKNLRTTKNSINKRLKIEVPDIVTCANKKASHRSGKSCHNQLSFFLYRSIISNPNPINTEAITPVPI